PDIYSVVEALFDKLNLDRPEGEIVHEAPYAYAVKVKLGDEVVGTVGMLYSKVTRRAGVKQEVLYAELNWELLAKFASGVKKYVPISKFPEVRRDLSLVIDRGVAFADIRRIALRAGGKLLQRMQVFDVYQGDKIEAG